ncbi:MAG: class I SAM-dependent methyltransferase [Candidatus Komeilibacteria bacterium]|nr:class I SAM-dependent methyltransferase [Candidatus Komeilibacteria bacterium]
MFLKDTYNKIAEDWHKDHESDTWWISGTNKFISFLKKGDLVLDVGCAGGRKSKYLIEHGLRVVGVDISEKFIEIAKKEVLEGEFHVLGLEDLDKLEPIFDDIFMQAVLLHLPKKEVWPNFKKAVTKLKTGGYLYVAVKEKYPNGPEEEIKDENDYGYSYQRFFSYFTLDEILDYFHQAGLEVIFSNVSPIGKTNWIEVIGKSIK